LDHLNNDFYFIYDQIYDYTKASRNTAAFGGGLIGGLAGSAAANRKSPGLIEIKSSKLTTFSKKEMKDILLDQYDLYQYYIDYEEREEILKIFKGILENEDTKRKILNKT
jgi:hypothetical protein